MHGHILRWMVIDFVAMSGEERRFLLVKVLNDVGKAYDQQTKRDECFIA